MGGTCSAFKYTTTTTFCLFNFYLYLMAIERLIFEKCLSWIRGFVKIDKIKYGYQTDVTKMQSNGRGKEKEVKESRVIAFGMPHHFECYYTSRTARSIVDPFQPEIYYFSIFLPHSWVTIVKTFLLNIL